MTHFLFTTLPTNDLGLLTRSLPIARELRDSGHAVRFFSPAQAPARLIADAGFDNVLPRHALFDVTRTDQSLHGVFKLLVSGRSGRRGRSVYRFLRELIPALPWKSPSRTVEVWNMDHAGALMGMLNEGFVRANVIGLRDLMLESHVDVVVDFWNPFAVAAARAARKPVVTVIQSDAHPKSNGFIWWKSPPTDLISPVPTVNCVLSALGLPPVRRLEDLCIGDLTLVVGTPETDPLPPGTDVTYIGPALWQKPGAELPAWILHRDRDRPLIWVYSGNPQYSAGGSYLDSLVVLESCREALAGLDLQVVVTTGHHALPDHLMPLPDNFRHEPYVPGLAMAEQSDLLIHHGGYGSCQTGLYMGRPAVVIPTFSERESNARRLAALGAGVMILPQRREGRKYIDPRELREAVRLVLGTPSFGDAARRASEALRRYGGAPEAARLIDLFARRHRAPEALVR